MARSLGPEYIDRTGYSRSPNGTDLQDTLDAQPCARRSKRSDVQPGDLLLMRFKAAPAACRDLRQPDHHPRLRAARRCCGRASVRAWARRVVGVYRFVRPADEQRRQILGGIGSAIIGGLAWWPDRARSTARRLALPLAASSIRQRAKPDSFPRLTTSACGARATAAQSLASMGPWRWLEPSSGSRTTSQEVSKKDHAGAWEGLALQPRHTAITRPLRSPFAKGQSPVCAGYGPAANLIYDAGSNDIETVIASNSTAEGFRLRGRCRPAALDERMQATLGDCPAHRGVAYIIR